MVGADLISRERLRQLAGEGYTAQHDNEHRDGELLAAAACYVRHAGQGEDGRVPADWPWEPEAWKPSTMSSPTGRTVRDLVRAGALIAAEIDRLGRHAASTK